MGLGALAGISQEMGRDGQNWGLAERVGPRTGGGQCGPLLGLLCSSWKAWDMGENLLISMSP